MPSSGLPNLQFNDQGTGLQVAVSTGVDNYASNAYGAAWATTATINTDLAKLFPNPVNGDECFLWNTTITAGRYYIYANGAWRNGSNGTDVV